MSDDKFLENLVLNQIITPFEYDPFGSYSSPVIDKLLQVVHEKLEKKYGTTKIWGRHRMIFFSKHCVIKLPMNEEGLLDNASEASQYRESLINPDKYIPLARCRLIYVNDIPVLFMEKLSFDNIPYGKLPEWTDWIDGGQVAFNKQGNLVAYDYA